MYDITEIIIRVVTIEDPPDLVARTLCEERIFILSI